MPFLRKVIPGSSSRLTIVDHRETYGRHLLAEQVRRLSPRVCVDIGCGSGVDLATVRRVHPGCIVHGIEFSAAHGAALAQAHVQLHVLDIERERLPFEDESVDLVIANQVLEHTKEIYWILHEIVRVLRPGGHLFLGVPNLLSLHNRLLMLGGWHPTQHKLYSAHVRVFSVDDIRKFFRHVVPDVVRMHPPLGAQFYPFPRFVARPLARWFPSLAFSIFFLVEKCGTYRGEILRWPEHAALETNFRAGPGASETGEWERPPLMVGDSES